MSDELGIQLEVEFESYDKVNEKLQTLLTQLKQNNINIGINFDSNIVQNNIKTLQNQINNSQIEIKLDKDKLDKQLENIKKKLEKAGNENVDVKWNGKANTAIVKYTDELGNAQKQVYKLGEVSEKVGDEIQKHFKFKLFIDDNQLKNNDVFLELKKRQIEIEKFANTKAKIDIKADGKDKIQSAIITWTDNVGRLQKEYYKLNETLTETQNKIKKTTSFDLTQTTYTDNIEKSRKALNNLKEEFKSLQKETSNLTYDNTSQNFNQNYVKGIKEIKRLLGDLNNDNKLGITQEELNNINKYLDALKLENIEVKNSIEYEKERTRVLNEEAKIRKQIEKEAAGGNIESAKNSAYSELNKLQKEEFSIKEKILGADESKTKELGMQLNLVKQQQSEMTSLMKKNNLVDSDRNKDFLVERRKLTSDLAIAEDNYNKKLEQEQKNIDTLIRQTQESMKIKIQNLQTKYRELTDKSGVKEQLESFQQKLNNLNATSLKDLRTEIKDLGVEFRKIEADTKAEGNILGQRDSMGWLTTLVNNGKKFLSWYVTGGLIVQGKNAVLSSINNIKEMDTALVDLSKVVDISKDKMESMRVTALGLGKELGKSSVEIVKGMAEFGRVTKDLGEIKELTRVATMASNVTDLSPQEAAKSLNSAMISFKINAKDSMSVLNSWNEIQNNFKTSAKNLSDSINEVGSVARQAGIDIHTLNSLTTTLVSAMNIEGSEAGSGIKSMISRVYRLGADGIEDEGKAQKILGSVGIAVRDSKGEFREFNDILRDTTKTFGSLSSTQQMAVAQAVGGTHYYNQFLTLMKNTDLTARSLEASINSQGSAIDENSKYISSVSGKFEIFKTNLEAIKQSIIKSDELKGFLNIGNGIAETIQKIGGLKTAFIALNTIMLLNSKTYKGLFIDKDTGNLKTFNQMIDGIKKFGQSITAAKVQMSTINPTLRSGTVSVKALGVAFKESALAANLFKIAVTFGLSIAIDFAISGIMKLINRQEELRQKNQEVMQSYQQATKQNSDMISYLQNEGSAYDNLKNKQNLSTTELKALSEIRDRISTSFPEMITGYDSEGKAILDQTKSTKDLIEALKEKNKLENQKLMANGSKSLEETQKNLQKSNHELTQLKAQLDMLDKKPKINPNYTKDAPAVYDTHNIEDMTAKVAQLKREQASGKNVTNELAKAEDELKKIQIERKEILSQIAVKEGEQKAKMAEFKPYINAIIGEYEGLNEVQKRMMNNMIKVTSDDIFKVEKGDFTGFIANINKQIESLKDNSSLKTIDFVMNLKSPGKDDIKNYFESISKLVEQGKGSAIELTKKFPLKADSSAIQQGLEAYMKEIESQLAKMADGKEKDDLKKILKDLGDLKVSVKFDGIKNESIKETKKDLETLTKDLEFYYKMLDELHDKNKLSKSSVDEIFKTQQDLIPFIGNEAELREKVNQKIQEEEKLQKQAYQNMIANSTEYYNAKIKGNVDTTNKIQDMYKTFTKNLGDGYNVDLKNYHNLEQAKGDMTSKLLKGLLSQWGSYWGSFSQYWDDAKGDFNGDLWYGLRNSPEESKKFEEIRDKVNSFKKKFNEITIDPIKIDFTPINSSGVTPDKEHKEKKSPQEQIKDMDMKIGMYNEEKQAIENIAKELTKNKAIEESLYGNELTKKKQEDINLLQQKSFWLDKLHDKQVKDRDASGNLLKQFGFDVQGENITNYTSKMKEWIDIANNTNSSVEDRKSAQEHAKNLEEQVKLFYSLNKEITDNRTQWQQLQTEANKLNLDIVKTKIEDTTKAFEKFSTHSKELLSDLDLKEAKLDENDISGQLSILDERKKIVQDEINQKIDTLNKMQNIKAVSKEEQEALNEAFKKEQDGLRELQIEYERLNKTVKDTQDKKIKLTEDVESKITDMLKKQAEERKKVVEKEFEDKKKAIEDEYKTRVEYWQKIKKLYNSENTEDDRKKELSASQGDLDKLRQDYQTSLRDNSEAGKLKTEQLRKAIEDQEKKINDLITKQERERHNEYLDENISREEKEKASKVEGIENDKKQALDDIDTQWSSSKITDVVKEAMQTGFFTDVEGKVQNVKDAYGEFLDKFENGTSMAGQKLKEDFIKNFDIATNSVKELDKTHTEMSKTVDTNTTKTGENIKTNLNDNLTKTDTTIKEMTTSSETFTSTFTNGIDGLNQNITGVFIPNLEKIKDLVGSIDMSKLGIGGISSTKVTLPQTSNISSIANNIQNVRNNQPTTLKTDVHFSFGDVKTNMDKKEFVGMVNECKEDITKAVDEGINSLNYRR